MTTAHLPVTTAEAIELLRTAIAGRVVAASDPGYDDARVSGADSSAHPAVVVFAADVDDVVHAVRFARAAHLSVAVRSTGQRSGAAPDAAVLLDVAALSTVTVDPACCTATVGAGATWAAVIEAAAHHGLAPVPGEWAQRAAVSDTLSGGMGWLVRRHGLASDSVISFELVTPDGLVVHVSPDTQPELFWALSGAGDGSLGVVASIEIELHPDAPVYAGAIVYPRHVEREVLGRWRTWITGARPELTSAVVVSADGVAVQGCWSGSLDAGRALVDDWRAWQPPVRDDWRERSLADTDGVGDGRLSPQATTMTSEWANTLRDEILDALVAIADDAGAACVVEVRLAGGVARSRSGAAANGRGRCDQFLLTVAGTDGDASAIHARLAPFVTGSVFLDRTDRVERAARTRTAFGSEQWDRLCAVKVALDPSNRFRHGLVIAPARDD